MPPSDGKASAIISRIMWLVLEAVSLLCSEVRVDLATVVALLAVVVVLLAVVAVTCDTSDKWDSDDETLWASDEEATKSVTSFLSCSR